MNLPENFSMSAHIRKKKSMSFTIILVTALFIICTLPYSVAVSYRYRGFLETNREKVVLSILRFLAFSYHSFNFLIFILTNKQFLRECKLLLKLLRE